eukprot:COSAG01_NODE_11924_length_1834_cov_656.183862_3_plen_264_part_01
MKKQSYKPSDKFRPYAFTWNNYTQENEAFLAELKCQYLVYGHEIAPTTGTPHLQGYVYFKNLRSVSGVRKEFKGCSIEPAIADADPNRVYCTKDATDIVERGTKPAQGKRTDMERVRAQVDEGQGMRQIAQTATSYQSLRTAELLLKYTETSRNWKPKVYWFYGATGTGKTKTAHEMFPEAYFTLNNKWFEGYDAHEDVIIDDIRMGDYSYAYLLKLLDRYPFRVETKGGSRQFLAKNIVITAPVHPKILLKEQHEDITQLLRR